MRAHKPYGEILREARRGCRLSIEGLLASPELSVRFSPSYFGEVERGSRAPFAIQTTLELQSLFGMTDNRLLDARARYYEQSTLKLGLRPDQDEAALILSRRWASYSRDQVRRIVEAAS